VQRVTYRPPQDAVVAALRAARPARILDVGCGTGKLAARLARELPESRVTGCDFSRGMLDQARARSAAVAWVHGDAQRLPFTGGAFGAVVSTEAFHWFPEPEGALAEFHRVLAPGGRLLVALVNPPFEALSALSRLGSRLAGEPFRWPTPATMRRWVERAGFRVQAQRRIFRLPAPVLFPTVLTRAVREAHRAGTRRRERSDLGRPAPAGLEAGDRGAACDRGGAKSSRPSRPATRRAQRDGAVGMTVVAPGPEEVPCRRSLCVTPSLPCSGPRSCPPLRPRST
jgi:SAM-dependent methyltransferase